MSGDAERPRLGTAPRALTVAQMREADRRAIEEIGIPGVVLMENAGRGAAELALEMLGDLEEPRVLVLAGHGNNGGDGFVIARHLHNRRVDVAVRLLGRFDEVKGDARTHLDVLRNMGLDVREMTLPEGRDVLAADLRATALVVDALLGTGTRGEIRNPFRIAVEMINAACRPVLAVDIPSGLEGDTGRALGPCVVANCTATFAAAKTGMLEPDAKRFVGDLRVIDIGMPRGILVDVCRPD